MEGVFWCCMRTLEWDDAKRQLKLIDQRALPARLAYVACQTPGDVAAAILNMTVRGAPAIGVAAAFGLALSALSVEDADLVEQRARLRQDAALLLAARPTAVNLRWAVERVMRVAEDWAGKTGGLGALVLAEAKRMAEEDVAVNRRMAEYGASLISDGDTIIHHCNTGALAAVDWGTALGAIRMAVEQGKRVHVLVDETRPRLQGARLTAWELSQYGIPYEIITDNAAGHFLRSGEVSRVLFGADRVAANGDVANKIGTYMLSLAARAKDVPVICVAPTSSIDPGTPSGAEIPIEERPMDEVLCLEINGEPVVPAGARARNPAFDVTPHELISAIVTEAGIAYPPFDQSLKNLLQQAGKIA